MANNIKIFFARSEPVLVFLLVTTFCLVFFRPSTVHAHKVYIFAWTEGNTVFTESYLSGNKKIVDGLVRVLDTEGKELLRGRTDKDGEFSFQIPKKVDMRIVLESSMGHRTEYMLKMSELADRSGNTEVHSEGEEDSPPSVAAMDSDTIRKIVEEALDSRLAPVTKSLAELRKEKGPGFSEIIAGIGYILGIMGIALYFKARKSS